MVKSKTSNEKKKSTSPVKADGEAIGLIETGNYALKLHRAFAYLPKGANILAGMKPKAGHRFIYLDVSLKNTGTKNFEGGFLFIALRITNEKGIEYRKPAAALAAYTATHPEENNDEEYAALWEKFAPGDFHREIVYAVEVPETEKHFLLHLPTDKERKDWKTISFAL